MVISKSGIKAAARGKKPDAAVLGTSKVDDGGKDDSRLNVEIKTSLKKQVQIYAITHDTTIRDVVEIALTQLLASAKR